MRITDYLNQPDAYEGALELEKLLTSGVNSTLAKPLWESIADGSADVAETLIWVMHVAREIEKHVINVKVAVDAAPAALKAIGFYGRVDPYRDVRNLIETFAAFDEFDQEGKVVEGKKWTAKKWLEFIQSQGLLLESDEKTAINRINEIRNDLNLK